MEGFGNPLEGQLISRPELARVVRLVPIVMAKKSILRWTRLLFKDSIEGAFPAMRIVETITYYVMQAFARSNEID